MFLVYNVVCLFFHLILFPVCISANKRVYYSLLL